MWNAKVKCGIAKRSRMNDSAVQSSLDIESNPNIEFKNEPFVTWMYTDHELKYDFVCVAVPIISGSQDVNFTLSEDGMKVIIGYTWPSSIYTAHQMFNNELTDEINPITIDHPKIHAFRTRLLELNLSENSRPRGSVTINLPIKVQRDSGTWKKSGKKCSADAKIAMLEFRAYQREIFIAEADTSINFHEDDEKIQ